METNLMEFTFVSAVTEEYLCNQRNPVAERARVDSRVLANRTDRLTDFSVKKECLGLVEGSYITKYSITNNSTKSLQGE